MTVLPSPGGPRRCRPSLGLAGPAGRPGHGCAWRWPRPGITVTVTGVSPSPSPGTAPHGTLPAVNLGLYPCYQLTINTAGYPASSYTLSFAAGNDPTTHTAQFVVP